MADIFQTLATSGDQFSVGGLLASAFALTVTALYREWIVLGKPYHRCMQRVDEFEAKVAERAKENEEKLAQLEKELSELRSRDVRRRP